MTATTRKYNPGFLSDDELIGSFCVRMDSLASMVEVLRECTGSSNTHQIVIGPRGCGKTSLLLRVAAEVRRDKSLSSRFFPIVFAEESYEVSTAGEFWLEGVSRLADQVPHGKDGPDFKRTIEDMRHLQDDRTLADRCLGVLQDFADSEGKRLVLIVENLNMMFREFVDSDTGWRLRQTLQTEPRLILLASATSRFDDIGNPDCAFYDLFRELTLRPLDPEACSVLWQAVSGRDRPPKTIRALRILTGGSPRLLTIVARFGANLSFRELMDDLLDLVDDHTEYFKSHLDSLPAQERRVYVALAHLWIPATAREIADRARLDTSKCSAQLARLVERGAVKIAGGSARRKQYYLVERLYNIYYLMRSARGPAPLIEALIRFMEAYYSPSELKGFVIHTVREAMRLDYEARRMYRIAFDRLLKSPALSGHREELSTLASWVHPLAPGDPGAAKVLFSRALEIARKGHESDAIALWDEAVQRLETSNAKADLETVAAALNNKGTALYFLNRTDEALATWDEVVRRFGSSRAAEHVGAAAMALSKKAFVLLENGRPKEALALCKDVLHRLKQGSAEQRPLEIAEALLYIGFVLRDLAQPQEALRAWDELVQRFGASSDPATRERVGAALHNKGALLAASNHLDEALAAWDEIAERFGACDSPAIYGIVTKALVGKGTTLVGLKRLEEALEAWDEALRRSTLSDDPTPVGIAVAYKSMLLDTMGRREEGRAFRDEAVQHLSERDEPRFVLAAVEALERVGAWLVDQNRFQEALAVSDDIVGRFGSTDAPMIRDAMARVFAKRGETLAQMNRREEALAVWEDVVRRFGPSDTAIARDSVVMSLVSRGSMLADLDRPQDALDAMGDVIRRFGTTSTEPLLQNAVSTALLGKARALVNLNRLQEALAAYDEVLNRDSLSATPELVLSVAAALVAKGGVLVGLNRLDAALALWADVVRRFGTSDHPTLRHGAKMAQLKIAELHLAMGRGLASVAAVDRLFEPESPESPEVSCQGRLTRARAHLLEGNDAACMLDVETALTILSGLGSLRTDILDGLCWLAVELGPAQLHELIAASPASGLLLPLRTALEKELGLETRVAKEVEEVAEDIHRDLEERRKGRRHRGT